IRGGLGIGPVFSSLAAVNRSVISCTRCPRLRAYCRRVAREKKREFRDSEYWGKPVPGFGDPRARLLVVGLAPAAHGANRTGGMVGEFGPARPARVPAWRGRDAAGRHDSPVLLPSEPAEYEHGETNAADVARGLSESTTAHRGVRRRDAEPPSGCEV